MQKVAREVVATAGSVANLASFFRYILRIFLSWKSDKSWEFSCCSLRLGDSDVTPLIVMPCLPQALLPSGTPLLPPPSLPTFKLARADVYTLMSSLEMNCALCKNDGWEEETDWLYVSNVVVQIVSLFSFSMVMATQKVLLLCHLL